MKSTFAATILLTAALFAQATCAAERFSTRDQLNDAGQGVWADDTANVLKPRQLLYESQQDGRIQVRYNLIRQGDGDVKGYFVRLTIKNLTDDAVQAADEVTLIDAERSVISASDRDAFLEVAKTLADTKGPSVPRRAVARSPSGPESVFQAYLRGQSEGRTIKAAADVELGRKMTVWADSFWLKPVLDIPPHGQVSGIRVFLAEPYHPLPLTLHVQIGASGFDFTTRAK